MRRRASLAVLGTVLYLGTLSTLHGSWIWKSAPDVATDSDLIVEATLTDLREFTMAGTDFAFAHLRVTSVIFGEASTKDELELRWQNQSHVVCPRLDHSKLLHRPAVWLLNVGLDGSVTANYPKRAVALTDGPAVARFVQELQEAKGTQSRDARVIQLLRFMEPLKTSSLSGNERSNLGLDPTAITRPRVNPHRSAH